MPQVKASQGNAKVYILKLNDVGAWGVNNISAAVEGAIEACTPKERHYNIPTAHPKHGEIAPYYDIEYQVVTDWSAYLNIIQNEVGAIIVNTHGEILPVPSGYLDENWVDAIADAMITRSVKWVHMAGYPFYFVWHQGSSEKSFWGVNGFKAFMSHIGLYNVELPMNLPSTYTHLTGWAGQILEGSWNLDHAKNVLLNRPLQKSVFKDYCALPIYEIYLEGETWWEGAIIDFAKPGERLDLEDTYTFGAFIHLGTSQTYTEGPEEEPTNSDKWRAYVATAVAIWIETARFEDAYDVVSNELTQEYTAIHVAPGIVDQWWEENDLVVRIGFGIYGLIKGPVGDSSHNIEPYGVGFIVNGSTLDWRFWAQLGASKNGAFFEDTLEDLWSNEKLAASTALWMASWACPAAAPVFSALGGLILLSNWVQTLSDRCIWQFGVEQKDTMVMFSYEPNIMWTTVGGYWHQEFQSMIFVDVYIPKQGIADWRVIPFDFSIGISTYDSLDAAAYGATSLVVWLDNSDEVSVFLQDFEDGMGEWNAEDKNPNSGLDYWGISDYKCTKTAWCAQVGTNSLNGEVPNPEVPEHGAYDKDMDAWLTRTVDLRPYQWANLSYFIDYDLKADSNDALELYFKAGDTWYPLNKRYTNHENWLWDSVLVPTDASEIGFQFYSDNDTTIDLGVFLDNIGIRGKLHNDAPYQHTDAQSFANPNTIAVAQTWTNYAGYLGVLNDTEDWYNFAASAGQLIEVKLTSPPNVDFKLELYDQNGAKKAGPSDIIRYIPSQTEGNNWRIKIYTNSGSGQYNFDIRVKDAPLCALKTCTDGWFYVPNMTTSVLQIEMLFNNSNINGDQGGNQSLYPTTISHWPNGFVDMIWDIRFIADKFGTYEGGSRWDYMADVVPDRQIDMAGDIRTAAKNFGKSGAYVHFTVALNINVTFYAGDVQLPDIRPDDYGFVTIPQGATRFRVKNCTNGNFIGAMVLFW